MSDCEHRWLAVRARFPKSDLPDNDAEHTAFEVCTHDCGALRMGDVTYWPEQSLAHERQQREAAEAGNQLGKDETTRRAAEYARVLAQRDALKSYTAKLLALAVEQRRALEDMRLRSCHRCASGIPFNEDGTHVCNQLTSEGTPCAGDECTVDPYVTAALEPDLDALINKAKELGIDATTPAMAPETGDAPR